MNSKGRENPIIRDTGTISGQEALTERVISFEENNPNAVKLVGETRSENTENSVASEKFPVKCW